MTSSTTRAPARELTDWFPADVKPVHVGVYEIDIGQSFPVYSMFDGEDWHWGWDTRWRAAHNVGAKRNPMHYRPWRGLRSPAA